MGTHLIISKPVYLEDKFTAIALKYIFLIFSQVGKCSLFPYMALCESVTLKGVGNMFVGDYALVPVC